MIALHGTMSMWHGMDRSGKLLKDFDSELTWPEFGVRLELEDGSRWVRGPKMITEARNVGWHDLADALEKANYRDKE